MSTAASWQRHPDPRVWVAAGSPRPPPDLCPNMVQIHSHCVTHWATGSDCPRREEGGITSTGNGQGGDPSCC